MGLNIEHYTWSQEIYFVGRLLLALVLGSSIGWEREIAKKEAGIRTFGLIALGACAYALSSQVLNFADPTRVAANIVVGIGFIGGGVIFHNKMESKGLTTAASLWVSAGIGLTVGFGLFLIGIALTLLTALFLHLPATKFWRKVSAKGKARR